MGLSASEECALIARHRAGDKRAAGEIIKAFEPLVKSFAFKRSRFRVDKDDVMQEARLGLVRAMDKYDPAKGMRFGHYAKWWIRSYVDLFIARNWTLVPPPHREQQRSIVVTVYNAIGRGDGSLSMNAPGYAGEWGDSFPDPGASPEEICVDADTNRFMRAALASRMAKLKPKEQQVITQRWLSDEAVRLHDLAVEMGVSNQRVQQIERAALAKIGVPDLRYPTQDNA